MRVEFMSSAFGTAVLFTIEVVVIVVWVKGDGREDNRGDNLHESPHILGWDGGACSKILDDAKSAHSMLCLAVHHNSSCP